MRPLNSTLINFIKAQLSNNSSDPFSNSETLILQLCKNSYLRIPPAHIGALSPTCSRLQTSSTTSPLKLLHNRAHLANLTMNLRPVSKS